MVLDPPQPKPDAAWRQTCPDYNDRAGARLLPGKEGARLTMGVYSYGTRPAVAEA